MKTYSKRDLLTEVLESTKGRVFKKTEVRFLLNSDKEIKGERRVGLVPDQVGRLGSALKECGLELKSFVVKGAGVLDKDLLYPDKAYEKAGAVIVDVDALNSLENIDVVHALKEPTSLEAMLPHPFLRIGALHLAAKPDGVCRLLAKKNFAALFDGSTLGDCSYLTTGDVKNPVVASMSRIAGDLAAEHLLAGHDRALGKVIVFGAGIAGVRAIVTLRDRVDDIIVVEKLPEVRERLNWLLLQLGFHKHRVLEGIPVEETQEIFQDAEGIIFAQRTGAKKAEKVCKLKDVKGIVKPNAGIVDIAIDQGGSIDYDAISENDDIEKKITTYADALQAYRYYAETNMPKEKPREGSEMHGYSILPYCAALLILCAEHGGPAEAAAYILSRDTNKIAKLDELPEGYRGDFFQSVVQDLRNGLELAVIDGAVSIKHPDIEKDEILVKWIQGCAAIQAPDDQ